MLASARPAGAPSQRAAAPCAREPSRSRRLIAALIAPLAIALLALSACDDAPSTTTDVDRVRRAPDLVGKGLQQGLALGDRSPRLQTRPAPPGAVLRRVVDLTWRTKARPPEGVRRGLLALVRASTEPPRVTVDDDTRGSVSFQGAVANPYGSDARAAETMARRWFAELGLAPGRGLMLRAQRREVGEAGDLHVMFDVIMPAPDHEPAGALPVWNVALHAHFDSAGALTSLHGTGLLPIAPPDEVRLDAEAAQRAAARALGIDGAAARALEPIELGVWRGLSEAGEGARAFRVVQGRGAEVFATFVDARTGVPIAVHPLSHSEVWAVPTTGSATDYEGDPIPVHASYAPSLRAYALLDQSQPARGRIYTHDGANRERWDPPGPLLMASPRIDAWDVAGATAHHHARLALDYLWTAHGRNSWDDRGGDLHVVVHVGSQLMNAFFYGGRPYPTLRFGDGIPGQIFDTARCLDIVAHELGHGVIDTTVPLVYQGMSGALNESIADVFGVLVDDANWTLAEHCVGARWQFLRSMAEPRLRAQPASMAQYLVTTEDYGGVHINSGIPNRAAYLVARARGRALLGSVWYRTLKAAHVAPRASFDQMALGTLSACAELVKAGRASPDDCRAVAAGWAEVGVAVLEKAGAGACPEHAHAEGGVCICDDDYTPSRDGAACLPLAGLLCGANTRIVDGECTCAVGYHEAGGACTNDPTACPVHSAYAPVLGRCACSEGFEGDPFAPAGCVVIPSTCPRNAHPEWAGDRADDPGDYTCVCNAGFEFDPARGDCAVRPGSCGAETFRGRCDGSGRLVYCTSAGKPSTVDCAASGHVCGLVDEVHGHDCLNPDGQVAAGACDPSASQECDDASPLCIAERGESRGFCSHACTVGADCPQPFACCAPIGDGTRACLLAPSCATATDPRSVCTDVAGSSTYGTCLSEARLSYCDPATRRTVEVDCAARGQVCGLESVEAGHACVADARPKRSSGDGCASADDGTCDVPARCPEGSDVRDCHPCGEVTAAGTCSGAQLAVCDAALGLVTTDCGALSPALACSEVGGVAACRPPAELPARDVVARSEEGGCSAARAASGQHAHGLLLFLLALLVRRRRVRASRRRVAPGSR